MFQYIKKILKIKNQYSTFATVLLNKIHIKVTGAFLLILYAFITLPVEFWHHHPNGKAEGTSNYRIASNQKGPVLQAQSGTELSCQICSHKYSSYANDFFVYELTATANFYRAKTNYHIYNTSVSCFHLSNKSPPHLFPAV
jgi:hypothetical protein